MTSDRRQTRILANISTQWQSGTLRKDAVIRDISKSGCFIVSSGQVARGATVKVDVGLPEFLHMTLQGTVTRLQEGLGFAVRFKDLTATQRILLVKLLQYLADTQL
jgi:hypothetical protein